MSKFLDYNPDQAYLQPPSVRDVLGPGHLCFFLRRVVAKLNLEVFRNEYGVEGGPAYAPEMLVSVWLYAYALSVTSSRRLEQRIREDLAFRYLAGGATPDYWTLNAFRRRHAKGLNDVFRKCWNWRVPAGWAAWGTWPSIRRALRRTLRGIASTASKRCGTSVPGCAERFAVGKSSAMRRIPTKARAWKSAAKCWHNWNGNWAKFPRG